MKITQRSVAALALPGGKADAIHFDDALPGFGVRLRKAGSRMFVVCYKIGAKQRRVTLGSTAMLTADAARTRAAGILLAVRTGSDPQAERSEAQARAGDTFRSIAQRYLALVPLGPRPWLHRLRSGHARFVRRLCSYYGGV